MNYLNDNTNAQQNNGDAPIEVLRDESSTGRVRPWRPQKVMSSMVARSMVRIYHDHPKKYPSHKKRGQRMADCAGYLVFGEYVPRATGEVTRRLDAASFCRDRMCPMCQWRKSLVTFAQVSTIMNVLQKRVPDAVPIFLTLTVRNCKAAELGNTVTRVLKGWSTLTSKCGNPKLNATIIGWFRTLEITYNSVTQEWHPHIHAIVIMPSSYFSDTDKYMSNRDWQAAWKKAARLDYDPIVDVRRIASNDSKAVAEVSKYAVKPGDWLDKDNGVTDRNVALLSDVLKGRRLVAFGKAMMEIRKELKQVDADNADLVNTDCDTENMRDDIRIALVRYNWQSGITNNYVFSKREVIETESE